MNSYEGHTNEQLFSLIALGEEEAFDTIFHRFVPQLMPVLTKIVQSESAAGDVLQEVFLYIWIGRESLQAVETPANWIFKIAYHRAYSWLSKQATARKYQKELENLSVDITVANPENLLAFNETRRQIYEAVLQLPPQAKTIFKLSREQGLKPKEIADKLGLSVQTVRNSLVRSTKSIKDYLSRQGIILPATLLWLFLK